MLVRFSVVIFFAVALAGAHPTMYKVKENNKFEPDLVPVSSTVIPLPVYSVGHGINVVPSSKGHKIDAGGPATLITAQNKKKYYYSDKAKKTSD